MRCLPVLLILVSIAFGLTARAQTAPDLPPGFRRLPNDKGIVAPMIFPVCGRVSWVDTWGAPRDGGRRQHRGQDLMAARFTPLVATWNGRVYFGRSSTPNTHNVISVAGDHGWSSTYMHVNNDNPGTDDGLGSMEFAFAPDLQPGDRVIAGQFLGWVGDSGNAEGTSPHCHFELSGPMGTINAAPSLRAATRITQPRWVPISPSLTAGAGEVRLDGVVRLTDLSRGQAQIDITARAAPGKRPVPETRPASRVWLSLSDAALQEAGYPESPLEPFDLAKGVRLSVLARGRGPGRAALVRVAEVHPPTAQEGIAAPAVTDSPPVPPDPPLPNPEIVVPENGEAESLTGKVIRLRELQANRIWLRLQPSAGGAPVGVLCPPGIPWTSAGAGGSAAGEVEPGNLDIDDEVMISAVRLGPGLAVARAVQVAPQSTPAPSFTTATRRLKTLVAIYRAASGDRGAWDDARVAAVRKGLETARLFYYRNSRCRLDLDLEFKLIDGALPARKPGAAEPLEVDLRRRSIPDRDYALVYALGPSVRSNWSGFRLPAGGAGALGTEEPQLPLASYPEADAETDYGAALTFAHQIHHALERLVRARSRYRLLHAHPYADFGRRHFVGSYAAGDQWDWLALTLRQLPAAAWLRFGAPGSEIRFSADTDRDGLPDSDPLLPLDEARFGSDPGRRDTDRDGLDDLGEFAAGIYAGSDPLRTDTDRDEAPDGVDPYPLVRSFGYLSQVRRPEDAGPILFSSVARTCGPGPIAVRAGWEPGRLHLWFLAPHKVEVRLLLDGSPENGFWEGGDSYAVTLDESGASLDGYGIVAPIAGAESRAQLTADGAYLLYVGLPAELGPGVTFASPKRPGFDPGVQVAGLTLSTGRRLGFNVQYLFADGTRAAVTPPYSLISVDLTGPR